MNGFQLRQMLENSIYNGQHHEEYESDRTMREAQTQYEKPQYIEPPYQKQYPVLPPYEPRRITSMRKDDDYKINVLIVLVSIVLIMLAVVITVLIPTSIRVFSIRR